MTDKKFPDVSKEAIVRPEDVRLKSADPDMDSDDNLDIDPEL